MSDTTASTTREHASGTSASALDDNLEDDPKQAGQDAPHPPGPGAAGSAVGAGDRAGASAAGGGGRRPSDAVDLVRLEQEGEIAADYLEGLLDIADLDGDIDMDVEGQRAAVSIVAGEESAGSDELRDLVGRNGEVLEALQELIRLAVLTATGERSRLMLDINGHRRARREELTRLGTQTAQRVNETREAIRLAPMSPFERKVVHDAVAASGARSESEGEEPQRRVVVLPG